MNSMHAVAAIVIMSTITIFIRFLPFVIFKNRETPKFIKYLGDVLPYSVMGMLIIYCLRDMDITEMKGFLPQVLGVVSVVVLHTWRRNALLSIGFGTAFYMFLVQAVFV